MDGKQVYQELVTKFREVFRFSNEASHLVFMNEASHFDFRFSNDIIQGTDAESRMKCCLLCSRCTRQASLLIHMTFTIICIISIAMQHLELNELKVSIAMQLLFSYT